NNCSTLRFNDVGTWPVNTGHPCFGCSEEGVGFHAPLYSPAEVLNVTPPAQFVSAQPAKGKGASALAAAVAGAAIGAGAVAVGSNMGKKDQDNKES
ncbi:MAG: hypothetical protein KAG66_03935, partial [Methylococcales bacterium]|nr:hypothetical protein [Methylococcales bacterium]